MTTSPSDQLQLRSYLCALFRRVKNGEVSVFDFCTEYENLFNFELDRSILPIADEKAFEGLFDTAAWYSPHSDERAKIPNYVDEATVLLAVQRALDVLCCTP